MNLTKRQIQIVTLLAQGNTAEQCAAMMHRSAGTVRRHIILACERVKARNTTHLVALAITQEWIRLALVLALSLFMATDSGDDQYRNNARLRMQRPHTQLRREV
ncbi:LuxR C-terminal-related transcriptional regulator [Vreelandella sedimenti]|uniref:LuxR C-terminal-related transcriptional regulator n=1 Tax=Vreelandella TaxID=3137766 RepID=UPI00257D12D7|nr:LuxR C-terminal-related transcriptional regulator [Halomonas sp. UBA3173]|tara:strand:- start:44426 stop:44737 length:312 start_codon:yes stop_codon:yes gene_type:complete